MGRIQRRGCRSARTRASSPLSFEGRRRRRRGSHLRGRDRARMRPLSRLRVDQRLLAEQQVVHRDRRRVRDSGSTSGPGRSVAVSVFVDRLLASPSGLRRNK
jgi:hypothetical protein